jgi:hypothetical protein
LRRTRGASFRRRRQASGGPPPALPAGRTPAEVLYDQNTRFLGISFYRACEGDPFTKLSRYENNIRRAYYRP